jgi:hypothetical protein
MGKLRKKGLPSRNHRRTGQELLVVSIPSHSQAAQVLFNVPIPNRPLHNQTRPSLGIYLNDEVSLSSCCSCFLSTASYFRLCLLACLRACFVLSSNALFVFGQLTARILYVLKVFTAPNEKQAMLSWHPILIPEAIGGRKYQ